MKILLIVNQFPFTSEAFIVKKIKGLLRRSHEIIICCSVHDKALHKKLFAGEEHIKIIEFNRKKFAKYLLIHPFEFIDKSRRQLWHRYIIHVVNHQKPALVHFEFSGLACYYLPVIKKLESPVVVSFRNSSEKINIESYKNRKEDLQQLFQYAAAVHCVSADVKNIIAPYCPIPQKIFINYPSLPVDYFKKETGYQPKDMLTILSIGRLHFKKGYLMGLLAVKELAQKQNNFQWIIIGEGEMQEEINMYIHTLGLQHNVQLAGTKYNDEIKQAYANADIFLLPSFTEGIANVALEAMSMELPVVSTNCGGMAELIEHNVNGLLANVFDPHSIAEQLQKLMNDFELRKRLGIAARNTVVNNFNIERQIDVFEEWYKKIAK